MSDPATPTEQLTAYERWELPNFGKNSMAGTAQPNSFDRQNNGSPDIVLPTAAQLEEIQRQAHDEGYQAGYQVGYAEGAQRISALLDAMEHALQQADQESRRTCLNCRWKSRGKWCSKHSKPIRKYCLTPYAKR
jgi:hypothetical protein